MSAILIGLADEELLVAHGRLLSEGVRDVRHVNSEEELGLLGDQAPATRSEPVQAGGDAGVRRSPTRKRGRRHSGPR